VKRKSEAERYVSGARWSIIDAGTSLVLGLASAILLARVFGATTLGAFAIASLLTGSFGLVANVRQQGGLVRELTRHEPGSPESRALLWVTLVFSAGLMALLFAPFGALAIVLLNSAFDRPELVGPFLLLAAGFLVLDNTSFNLTAPLAAYRDGRAVWLGRTTQVVATVAAALTCAALDLRSVYAIVGCNVFAAACGVVVRLWSVARLTGLRCSRADLRWAVGRLRAILSFGLRQAPTNYTETAIRYAGTTILGLTVPLAALGAYNRAYQLFERAAAVPVQVSGLYFPTLCAMFVRGDRDGMARVYRLTVRYLVLVLLPGVTWLAVASPAVMALFGPGFEQASAALAVLGFAVVVDTYGRLAGGVSSAANQPGRISIITLIGALTNVGLCLALIPPFGLVGAASATLGGFAVATVVSAVLAARTLHRPVAWMYEPGFLVRLCLACGLMAALLAPLHALPGRLVWMLLAAPFALAAGLVLARPLHRADEPVLERALAAAGIRKPRIVGLVLAVHARIARGSRPENAEGRAVTARPVEAFPSSPPLSG